MPPLRAPLSLAARDASLLSSLARRQNSVPLIPLTYSGEGTDPSPGTVIGIVLGSVLGFLLLAMLLSWALYSQSDTFHRGRGPTLAALEVQPRRSRSPGRRLSRRGDVTEIRRISRASLSPRRRSFSPRTSRRTEIVQERVERFPGHESVRRVVSPARNGDIIVEKRRSISRPRPRVREESEMEEVVVYDDESAEFSSLPPQQRRSSGRRGSGYGPDRYASGDYARRPGSRRYS
jgi:hypothetical protein